MEQVIEQDLTLTRENILRRFWADKNLLPSNWVSSLNHLSNWWELRSVEIEGHQFDTLLNKKLRNEVKKRMSAPFFDMLKKFRQEQDMTAKVTIIQSVDPQSRKQWKLTTECFQSHVLKKQLVVIQISAPSATLVTDTLATYLHGCFLPPRFFCKFLFAIAKRERKYLTKFFSRKNQIQIHWYTRASEYLRGKETPSFFDQVVLNCNIPTSPVFNQWELKSGDLVFQVFKKTDLQSRFFNEVKKRYRRQVELAFTKFLADKTLRGSTIMSPFSSWGGEITLPNLAYPLCHQVWLSELNGRFDQFDQIQKEIIKRNHKAI